MKAAKRRGVQFGHKPKLSPHQVDQARKLIDEGHRREDVAALLNVERTTPLLGAWSGGREMKRKQILPEIKRMALSNGGRPPGTQALGRECGMRKSDWYPHIWLRWSDALAEAGYAPNTFQTRHVTKLFSKNTLSL